MAIRKILDYKKRWLFAGVVVVAVVISGALFFLKNPSTSRNAAKASVMKPLVAAKLTQAYAQRGRAYLC